MNLTQVIAQLNDLPQTFRRPGATYAQLVGSVAVGHATFTNAADELGIESNSLASAQYGWLDVWGLLFGIQRNTNEADYNYRLRIQSTLLAWVSTIPAIENWAMLILKQTITLTENVGIGYVIVLPGVLSSNSLQTFITSLARIRPAGVPFQIGVQSSGLYLDTINYLDCPAVTGAYLTDSLTYMPLGIGPSTNNAMPILPSAYLNDPTLNPSL